MGLFMAFKSIRPQLEITITAFYHHVIPSYLICCFGNKPVVESLRYGQKNLSSRKVELSCLHTANL